MLSELLKNKNTIILIIIVILLGVLLFLNNSECSTNKNKIISANSSNTNSTLEKFNNKKVQFKVYYANWCGWSKRALAVINSSEFQSQMNQIKDKAEVVLVDCENGGENECSANNIRGFPTMILFKDGKPTQFNGERTTEGIISFIKENC
jgi:thioredoxin-like negative regulator of GroEL